jgi:hypothetical protein
MEITDLQNATEWKEIARFYQSLIFSTVTWFSGRVMHQVARVLSSGMRIRIVSKPNGCLFSYENNALGKLISSRRERALIMNIVLIDWE